MKHDWKRIPNQVKGGGVYECLGCGELIICPYPMSYRTGKPMSRKIYFDKLKISTNCTLQKVKQVMES
jgi:hypothetical protein